MTQGAYVTLHVVVAALLVSAVAHWPYGYYELLRWVVCAGAVWLAVLDYREGSKATAWVIVLGLVAILFNPIAPVYLSRKAWFFLDLLAAAIIAGHLWVTRGRYNAV
jgi:hypothetical protein